MTNSILEIMGLFVGLFALSCVSVAFLAPALYLWLSRPERIQRAKEVADE